MRSALQFILAIAALATTYVLFLGPIMNHLPWAGFPSWWLHIWPSLRAAAFAWLQALDVVGSLLAAIPIAATVAVFAKRRPYAIALCAAGGAATFVFVSSLLYESPWASPMGVALALANQVVYFLAMTASPALMLWLASRLPSNIRWKGPR